MEINSIKYLSVSSRDEDWGIVVTTIGYQTIEPKAVYPPCQHPNSHTFNPMSGRVLNEYQLLYITRGSGYFSSKSCKLRKVSAGTIILLFPGEWHNYYPNSDTGWKEYWVGFRGTHIDKRVENMFFTKESPIFNVGISTQAVDMYKNILEYAKGERIGYQQMISSIVLNILGHIYYHDKNHALLDSEITSKIDEARYIMKQNISNPQSPQDIAKQLGIGYSWFRSMFKKHTGISPAQYQAQQRLLKSKELLSTTTLKINEIAYQLNFDSGSEFATFFKRLESITPTQFRSNLHFIDGDINNK